MGDDLNPLTKYSLAGQGNALLKRAVEQKPLIDKLCMQGETSVWYAKPNTGKTLILLALIFNAVFIKRIAGSDVFYINADDTGQGLAIKAQMMDDFYINHLCPGLNGFKLENLIPALNQMAEEGTAKGKLVAVDTLKKFTDLMSKADCRKFGIAVRNFAVAGGTFIGLAHTNKKRSGTDKLIYAGTTDIIEDFDSAYILDTVEGKTEAFEQLVKFECLKCRGDNAQTAYFRYSKEEGLSYFERINTVTKTEPDYGDVNPEHHQGEEAIVATIAKAIEHGNTTKMKIIMVASTALKASRRKVQVVLDQFTGPNPDEHRWDFERRSHGAHHFFLHPEANREAEEAT